MADFIITLTVPEAKKEKALEGYLALYPNNEKNEDGSVKYTDAEWVKETVRRLLVRDIRRGLQKIATEAAQVAEDDTIAQ